jgi:hypothetical protein
MITTLAIIGLGFCFVFVYLFGVSRGIASGIQQNKDYWDKLSKIPLPGQTINVESIGEVVITGFDDARTIIFYIPVAQLKGKDVHELSEKELDELSSSCQLDMFVARSEIPLKFLV